MNKKIIVVCIAALLISGSAFASVLQLGGSATWGVPVDFDEDKAKSILSSESVQILVVLEDGEFEAKAWGCDLTYDYVKINGDYRT